MPRRPEGSSSPSRCGWRRSSSVPRRRRGCAPWLRPSRCPPAASWRARRPERGRAAAAPRRSGRRGPAGGCARTACSAPVAPGHLHAGSVAKRERGSLACVRSRSSQADRDSQPAPMVGADHDPRADPLGAQRDTVTGGAGRADPGLHAEQAERAMAAIAGLGVQDRLDAGVEAVDVAPDSSPPAGGPRAWRPGRRRRVRRRRRPRRRAGRVRRSRRSRASSGGDGVAGPRPGALGAGPLRGLGQSHWDECCCSF